MKRGSLIPRRSMTVFCEGAKGTMSEAELFVLRARRPRGDSQQSTTWSPQTRLAHGVVLHRKRHRGSGPQWGRVQATIGEVFHRFEHTGSAFTTVRHFHQEHLLFPRWVRCGPHQGEIMWGEIEHHDVLRVLHHPAYAGAYVF